MIRVVVADDQALVREGLVLLAGAAVDVTVVGEAADGVEAVAAARQLKPDVVLMDVRMPRMDGIAATAVIVRDVPSTSVLVLTAYDMEADVLAALRAGAAGFVLKDASREALEAAIRAVASGDVSLSPDVLRHLLLPAERADRRPPPPPVLAERLAVLTAREREVMCAVGEGCTNAQLAARLGISVPTVKTHVAHLVTKLRVRDRLQLVALASRYDIRQ